MQEDAGQYEVSARNDAGETKVQSVLTGEHEDTLNRTALCESAL